MSALVGRGGVRWGDMGPSRRTAAAPKERRAGAREERGGGGERRRLRARGDALEHARVGEGEGDVLRRELVVGLGLGHDLDKLGEVALVHLELAVLLVVHHVLRDVVEEDRVVRDDHRRDRLVGEVLHVLGEPRDAVDVDVVGRLVEQQQLGLLEHRARERQPHAPAARQRADRAPHQVLLEADGGHLGGDLVLGALGQVHVDEVDARHLRVRR